MSDLVKIAQIQAVQGEQIEQITDSCDKIEKCLTGNGKPGLVVRTDRLEQKDVFKTRLFWVFATAVVAILIKTVGIDLIGAFARASGN